MPYEIDPSNRKCIRKADSKKRVGCTKGSVKKYLTALRMHVNESTTGVDYKFLMNKTLVFNPPIDKEDYYNRLIPILKFFNVLWFDGMPLESKNIYRNINTFKFILLGNNHFDSRSQDNWILSIVEDDDTMNDYVTNEEYSITGKQYVESEKIDGWNFLNNYGDIINFDPFETLNESEEDELEWAEDIVKNSPITLLRPGTVFKCHHDSKWELQIKVLGFNESDVKYISKVGPNGERMYQNRRAGTSIKSAVGLIEKGYWTPVLPEDSLFNEKSINESDDLGWVEDALKAPLNLHGKAWEILLPGPEEDFIEAQKWALSQGFEWFSAGKNKLINRSEYDYHNVICTIGSIFHDNIRDRTLTFSGSHRNCDKNKNLAEVIRMAKDHSHQNEFYIFEWDSTKKEPILSSVVDLTTLNESEELDWVDDLAGEEFWVNFDQLNVGDYVIYKIGNHVLEPKDGGFWEVVRFKNCLTYNPTDWSTIETPCVDLQSVKDNKGRRYLTGENISVHKKSNNSTNPIEFKLLDKTDWLKNRNWNTTLNESEEELEWAEDVANTNPTYRFSDLVFKPHRLPGAVRARLNFPNGHYISVVGGPGLYGDGIDTFEIWRSDQDDVQGYLSKGDVTREMLELQELPPLEGGESINNNPWANTHSGPITESEEDELEWIEDIVSNNSIIDNILTFKGKEIVINIGELTIEEKLELKDVLRPYVLDYNGEDNIWWDNQCYHNEVFMRSSNNVISLHCGIEDNSYEPLNGAICCLGSVEDATKTLEEGQYLLIEGKLLLTSKSLKESEEEQDFSWVDDILDVDVNKIISHKDQLKNGDIIMVNGSCDDLSFHNEMAKVLDSDANDNHDYDILVLFNEHLDDGNNTTHCGDDHYYKDCGCDSEYESGIGKCYFLNVGENGLEIRKFPNRLSLTENKQNLLNEGRYDSLTRKVVKDIMSVVTSTKEQTEDLVQADLPVDLREEEFEYSKDGVTFSVDLNVHHQQILTREARKETEAYYVHTAISDDIDENVIMITVVVDPLHEPQIYEKLFYKLQEDIRHEIEHLTQENPDDTSKLKTTYGHHKNKFEVPALVHGFYRRAKLEKRPLDEVMIEDLDLEIERGNLNKKQAQKLLQIWVDYAKKNLPSAIYSE